MFKQKQTQFFTAWDKSTGISITESQISDLGTYLESVSISDINATGTPSSSTFLRGDGIWQEVSGEVTSVNGQTGTVVLDADDISNTSTRIWNSLLPKSGTWRGVDYFDAINPEGRWPSDNIGSNSIALGMQTSASGSYSLGIGYTANPSGSGSIALGMQPTASESGSIAIGSDASSGGFKSIALGSGAIVTGSESIQIGTNSDPLETAKALRIWTHVLLDGFTGLIPLARLGTGTADSATFLRGDGTWQEVSSGSDGTVTSVALSAPTGLSVSGSPITTSGTLALSFTEGYSIPTTLKQGQWDTAYGWGDHSTEGYLTSSSLTGYATETYVNTAIGDINTILDNINGEVL